MEYLFEKEFGEDLNESILAGVAIGGGIGAVSGKLSNNKNSVIVKNLKAALKLCKTDDCREKIQDKIDKYQEMVDDASGSTNRRIAGGAAAGALSLGMAPIIYHLLNKRRKSKDTRKLVKLLKLKQEYKNCEDEPCRNNVRKQVYILKRALNTNAAEKSKNKYNK